MTKKIVSGYYELQQRMNMAIESAHGKVAIVAGHYPLNSKGTDSFNKEDEDSFGYFSEYTLDLAINSINYAKKRGKDAKLVVLVDDHAMMDDPKWYIHDTARANEIRNNVSNYFSDYTLPERFQEKLDNSKLNLDDILQSNSGLAFQESAYREQFARDFPGQEVGCAGEYMLILQEIALKGATNLVSLIPTRCQGPTCNAVHQFAQKDGIPRMKTMHAYLVSGLDTPEDMLKATTAEYGGIPILREY